MKVIIGNDHAAVLLKKLVCDHLKDKGIEFDDMGVAAGEKCDYPDKAKEVCEKYLAGGYDAAILICGTGVGMSIAANKIKGIRAACCSDVFSARFTRLHNDANCLCFGERVVGAGLANDLVDVFLETPFEGGRHQRRVDKIMALENE